MTIRFVEKGWNREFAEALSADASELRIICPFIKAGVIDSLLSWQPGIVQVITLFLTVVLPEGLSLKGLFVRSVPFVGLVGLSFTISQIGA